MNQIIAPLLLLFSVSANLFSWDIIPSADDIFLRQGSDLIISGTVVNAVTMLGSQSGEVQILSVEIDNIYHKSETVSIISPDPHPDTIFVVMELTRPTIVPPAVQDILDQRRAVRPEDEILLSLSSTKSEWIFTFSDRNHPILKLYENDELETRLLDRMLSVEKSGGKTDKVDVDSTEE